MRPTRRGGIVAAMPGRDVAIIGAELDLGAGRRGVDMGPSAIRYAGLGDRIEAIGLSASDLGNVPAALPETIATGDERARFLGEIKATCERIAERVGDASARGLVPLVLGGDHSIALGTVRSESTRLNSSPPISRMPSSA